MYICPIEHSISMGMCMCACVCKCIYQYFEKTWRHLWKIRANQMGKYLMIWKFMQQKISIPYSHTLTQCTHTHTRWHTHSCAKSNKNISTMWKKWMYVWMYGWMIFGRAKILCQPILVGVGVFICGFNWHSLKFDVVAAPHRSIQNELNCWEFLFCDSLFFLVQNNYATRNTNFSHKCDGTIFLMRNMGTNVCRSCNVMSCDVIVIKCMSMSMSRCVCVSVSVWFSLLFGIMKLLLRFCYYKLCLQVANIVVYITYTHIDTYTINAACVHECVLDFENQYRGERTISAISLSKNVTTIFLIRIYNPLNAYERQRFQFGRYFVSAQI